MSSGEKVRNRKLEHLEIALKYNVEGPLTPWFEYVHLVHRANPDIDLDSVDLRIEILGKTLNAPLIISAMTGGHPKAKEINAALAEISEELGIGLGVGSQRAMIEDPTLEDTYAVVREKAPKALVIANIGAPQIARGDVDIEALERIVKAIEADALAIHLNPAQEAIQPEGEPYFRNLLDKVSEIVDALKVPIIIKEIGFGLSMEIVAAFSRIGIKYFDVAGAGGTNWILIEKQRAEDRGDKLKSEIASTFSSWGLPTAVSIIEARYVAPKAVIIGSGGIRSGLDAAKAIALGANACGLALPVLRALMGGRLRDYLVRVMNELKIAMFLTGARTVNDLRKVPLIITGPIMDWLKCRGIDLEKYMVIRSSQYS